MALVTFAEPLSSKLCMEEYAENKVMGAKFVGKRRERVKAMESENKAGLGTCQTS